MNDWYYAAGGERHGPVPADELQTLATAGRVAASTMVWTDGWPAWKPAASVPGLHFPETPPATAGRVSYFAPSALPPRAAAALAGYAAPTGDTGDWPLNDVHVAQLAEAGWQRKRVRRAYGLYRSLCVLTAFSAAILSLVTTLNARSFAGASAVLGPVTLGVLVLTTVLYGLAARATRRNCAWGPWAVFVMLIVSLVVTGLGMLAAAGSNPQGVLPAVVGNVVSLLFTVAFLWVSFRGLQGIKAFRASPAWCQEVLIRGEATKRPRDPAAGTTKSSSVDPLK